MGRSGMPALAAAPAPRRLGLGIAAPRLRDGLREPGGGGGHGRRGVAERLGDARGRVGRPARGGACRRADAPGGRADAPGAAADHVGRRADEALAGLRPAHRDGERRPGRDPERAEEPRVGADPVVGVAGPLVSVLGSAGGALIGVVGGRARPRRDVLGGGARAIERIGGRVARAIERIRGGVARALRRLGDAGARLGGGLAGPPADLARPFADLGRQRARLAARGSGFRHDAVGRRRAGRVLLDRVAVAGDAARDVAARLLCVIGRAIGGRIAQALAAGAHQQRRAGADEERRDRRMAVEVVGDAGADERSAGRIVHRPRLEVVDDPLPFRPGARLDRAEEPILIALDALHDLVLHGFVGRRIGELVEGTGKARPRRRDLGLERRDVGRIVIGHRSCSLRLAPRTSARAAAPPALRRRHPTDIPARTRRRSSRAARACVQSARRACAPRGGRPMP